MKIKFTSNPLSKRFSDKEAKIIARELKKIQSETSVITPEIVVAKAAYAKSPLHKYFQWDDTIAAERYREWQARSLILSVYVVDADDETSQPVRAFVNLNVEEDSDEFIAERGYVAITTLAGRQSYQNQVLQYAKDQLLGWRRRFGNYQQFFGVVKAIDSLKK